MPKLANKELTVGALTAVILGSTVTLALLGGQGTDTESNVNLRLSADFGRIDGLAVGSPVRLAGMNIGMVDQVVLTDVHRARVYMAFDDSSLSIPSDTAAVIETDGIFGEKYIELHPGGEFDSLSPGQSFTYTQDSVILENLLNQIVARARVSTPSDVVDSE